MRLWTLPARAFSAAGGIGGAIAGALRRTSGCLGRTGDGTSLARRGIGRAGFGAVGVRAVGGPSTGDRVGKHLGPDPGQGVGKNVAQVVERAFPDVSRLPRGRPQLGRELDCDSLKVTERVRYASPEPLTGVARPRIRPGARIRPRG